VVDGAAPAITVAATPATKATTRLVVLTVRPDAGRAKPKLSKRPLRSPARPIPPARPASEAMTPTARVSTMTAPMIWLRRAPRVRSSAASRVR